MAAAELTGGGDEGGAAQMWDAARLSSFDNDLLRPLRLWSREGDREQSPYEVACFYKGAA